ncbi:hypothetical protein DPMN_089501 [Dreissena polymorpha]|uniref:Uncharacterized protein n=1 Tax=Dreissena polymorpha TaxID=45954 RepID=A0A9D4QXH0_DREPO|nr:hypothetical protein DPMN_089501 [Dreissena polymorpha]
MSEGKIKRNQRKAISSIWEKLFSLWQRYIHRESKISASRLLRECAQVHGPATQRSDDVVG